MLPLENSYPHDSLVSLVQRAQSSASSASSSTLGKRKRAPLPRPPSAATFYVSKLPGQPDDIQLPALYSGHLPASYGLDQDPAKAESDAQLFFLLAKANHIADRPRLVIWFNGGPGCSSFDGALLEIGPVLVHGSGSAARLVENPGRWNEYADVLFIDQPAGTGYSYINRGKPVSELAPAADQVVTFLSNFYTVFPEYARIDTYIAGESYAGTTIPYLAKALTDTTSMPTQLRGLIMGNGWFSPAQQYPGYVKYGENRKLLKAKTKETKQVYDLMDSCNSTLALHKKQGVGHVLVGVCEGLIDAVIQAGRKTIDEKKFCINSYDVRPSTFCGEYPPGLDEATPYLQESSVVDTLHASMKSAKWTQCNSTVGSQMWSPRSRPAVELLPDLLEHIPMLFFAGDADLMCNWIGIQDTLEALTWQGQKGFGNATNAEWFVNGTLAGTWRESRNLTWVVVKDAGHMVPIDQPHAAHDILLRFMGVQTLDAAGDHSRIPSRVGGSPSSSSHDSVLGKVAPDGGTLPGVISSHSAVAAAAASSLAAAVDQAGEFGFGGTYGSGYVIDKERELMYGPRRTAVLVVIILAISVGFCSLLRWRARVRRRRNADGTVQGWHIPKSKNSSGAGTNLGKPERARSQSVSYTSVQHGPSSEDDFIARINDHERGFEREI